MLVNEIKRIIKIGGTVLSLNFDKSEAVIFSDPITIIVPFEKEDCDNGIITMALSELKLSLFRGSKRIYFTSLGEEWHLHNADSLQEIASGEFADLDTVPKGDNYILVGKATADTLVSVTPKIKTELPIFWKGVKGGLISLYLDPECCQLYKSAAQFHTAFSCGFEKKTVDTLHKLVKDVCSTDNICEIISFECWGSRFIELRINNGCKFIVPCVSKKMPDISRFIKSAGGKGFKFTVPELSISDKIIIDTSSGMAKFKYCEKNETNSENMPMCSTKVLKSIPLFSVGDIVYINSSDNYIFATGKFGSVDAVVAISREL